MFEKWQSNTAGISSRANINSSFSTDHLCKEGNDGAICSQKNCPLSIQLQAIISQLLSIQGIIPSAVTRILLKHIPSSNICESVDEIMERASRSYYIYLRPTPNHHHLNIHNLLPYIYQVHPAALKRRAPPRIPHHAADKRSPRSLPQRPVHPNAPHPLHHRGAAQEQRPQGPDREPRERALDGRSGLRRPSTRGAWHADFTAEVRRWG